MKASEVLLILRISRQTLRRYKKSGKIRARQLPTGQFDYDKDDVYKFLCGDVKRKTVIYARVSTSKQKKDLENQIELLKQWCFSNGYQISRVYSDVASGISFENRIEFFEMMNEIHSNRIERVVISYKDRLSRVGFDLFKYLFDQFGTELIVMSECGNLKLDSEEIFEEIVSLLHCYSMKLYSKRKNKHIEVGIDENPKS